MKPIELPLLVLAGGFGSRLRSVVSDVPKPLAPVGGVPFLELLIAKWVADGIRHFVFLLHYKASQIEEFIDQISNISNWENCRFTCVVEAEPLGTGGAVANALTQLEIRGEFLLANADSWVDASLMSLRDTEGLAMTVCHSSEPARFGRVNISDTGRVIGFEEKSGDSSAGWVNGGIYKLESNLFDIWSGGYLSLESELLPRVLEAEVVSAVKNEQCFIDIGIPDDYEKFCQWSRAKT